MPNRQTKACAIDIGVHAKCQRAASINKMPLAKWMNMVLTEIADKVIAEGRPIGGTSPEDHREAQKVKVEGEPLRPRTYRDDWNEGKVKDRKID